MQGTDYAYTIQGWIKGINSDALNASTDIGKDGETGIGNINKFFARDAFAYSLGYFNGDYQAIDPNKNLTANSFIASVTSAAYLTTDGPDLFNGNISHMVTSLTDTLNNKLPQLTAYRYDQLNRIKQMKAYRDINLTGPFANTWGNGATYDGSYEEHYTYNANGSILSLHRNGLASINGGQMDSITNIYENNGSGYKKNTNKLRRKLDAVSDAVYNDDIDSQVANNYAYDEIGNLVRDTFECIQNIEWTVYGKVRRLTRYPGCTTEGKAMPDLEFIYNPSGNLIAKIVKPAGAITDTMDWTTTVYTNDASGQIMATYEGKLDTSLSMASYKVKSHELYGSSHMGTEKNEVELIAAAPMGDICTRVLGNKNYFLSDHRSNNNVTITDKKKAIENVSNNDTIAYFEPNIIRAVDYHSFGREMNGRVFANDKSGFGYNGEQNIKEWSVRKGSVQNYGFRIKIDESFVSIDPLTKNYPFLTPYQFASDMPIMSIDLDGLESFVATLNKKGNAIALRLVNAEDPLSVEFADKSLKTDPLAIKEVSDFVSNVQVNVTQKTISFGDNTTYTYQVPQKDENGNVIPDSDKQGIVGKKEIAKHIPGDFTTTLNGRTFNAMDRDINPSDLKEQVDRATEVKPANYERVDVYVPPALRSEFLEEFKSVESDASKINFLDAPETAGNDLEIFFRTQQPASEIE